MKSHDSIRKSRKALLSDLSSLVKVTKLLQDVAQGAVVESSVDDIFDDMLLKAFKIVVRGVRFLDVWSQEVEASRPKSMIPSELLQMEAALRAPLTPPVDDHEPVGDTTATPNASEVPALDQHQSAATHVSKERGRPESKVTFAPPPVPGKRESLSHRTSYGRAPSCARRNNLASERLGHSYDSFLSVLGSFLGLHLQSRSSADLFSTTEQAVKSCRGVLATVEAVLSRGQHQSEALLRAKDSMYETITELVHATREIFKPLSSMDDDCVYMPEEGKRLVDAATSCVRSAGDCVVKTRLVLDQIGDFELEDSDLASEASASACPEDDEKRSDAPQANSGQPKNATDELTRDKPLPAEPSTKPIAPRLEIPERALAAAPQYRTDITPSSVESNLTSGMSAVTVSSQSSISPFSAGLSKPSPAFSDVASEKIDSDKRNMDAQSSAVADACNISSSAGSGTTFTGSLRDSGGSQLSTIPTSPDVSTFSPDERVGSHPFSGSQTTLADDAEDTEARLLEQTYAHELLCNKDGQVIGGTLPALIEKLTTHHSTPEAVFVSTFYLTFRLFANPLQFAETLVKRFEYVGQTPHIAGPVRLRVYNVFKTWLESHWRHDCDNVALSYISDFSRFTMTKVIPNAGRRLLELTEKVGQVHGPVVPRLVSNIGKTNTSMAQYVNPDAPLPSPIISKSQLNALKSWRQGGAPVGILDFDALELARQLTIKTSSIVCAILPEELLATEWMKRSGSLAVNVRATTQLATDLANFVADSILQQEEPKRRAATIKQWVKIANKCLELVNYESLMAIVCALNTSTITRLKRTWEIVSQKTKSLFELLKSIIDNSRNYTVLRQRLQNQVPPCLPFVGMYMTDLTFVDHGNQTTRSLTAEEGSVQVINFDKHMKTAKIISELQRFQVPHRLTEVPELQTWVQDQLVRVRSGGEMSYQNYYRRSLILEPRDKRASVAVPHLPKLDAKERFDFLSFHHVHPPPKEKSMTSES